MTRSSSESRVPPSPVTFSELGPGSPFGNPDFAPWDYPDADAGARRRGRPGWLWATAFTLSACGLAAFAVSVGLGSGRAPRGSVVAAAVGAVAAVLLLAVLAGLRRQFGAADAEASAAAAERQRLAAEWQLCTAELERRGAQRQAQYDARLSTLSEAVDNLVRIQLPAVLSGSAAPQSIRDSVPGANSEAAALCSRVAVAVAEGAAKLREQLDDQIESSRLAVVTLARRVQASAHRIQEEATRMASRHPADSDVLESSMRVDHAAAQQARHAQSVAVLCGEWPGQQWPQPLALLDVVRAASSRIVAYRRVTVSGEPDVAATASAVEPLIHLIAELLANATQSSPPTTQVLVTVRTVQRGAVIEMDDGGVGMEEHRLEQAREVISGARLLSLGDLGEVPQTGMAVIGQYVRRHGFRVDLMPSPYGGVRAIVLVPAEMVEILEPAAAPAPPSLEAPLNVPEVEPAPTVTLPQRRSRRGEAAQTEYADSAEAEPALSAQTPEQAGAWMAAYFSGSAGEAGTDAEAGGRIEPELPGGVSPLDRDSDSPGDEQA
jgi:signal transduction histidine kinase